MFTGIIERQALVRSMEKGKVARLTVEKPASWKFKLGASVAVDGVCLTVVAQTVHSFSADVVPETLARTTMRSFKKGRKVNLERPLRVGDEIGGHIVQGHVDTRTQVTGITKQGASRELTLAVPLKYKKFVVEKGSVAINGVSLTIARAAPRALTVALIPHTLKETNLGKLKIGDEVNIEFDSRHALAVHKKK
jgi:riboflavin synthase